MLRRPVRAPRVIGRRQTVSKAGQSGTGPLPVFGLIFPSNNAAGSDIRLVWSGANLLSRTSHTAIWKANYVQQAGYYAVAWHSENTGTWPASLYQFGTHPYPNDSGAGAVDGTGQATATGTSTDTTHYYEIAGLGAHDYLATAGGSSLIVTKSTWVTQARKCEVISGTTLRHTFYPDIVGNPSFSIVQDFALADLNSPGSPAFYIGTSDWTATGGANEECPSGTFRGFMLFDAALSLSDITTEAANETSNAAVTSAGQAAIWYCNKNPTPTDVADKQTQRTTHSPSWANANRPTLYTG